MGRCRSCSTKRCLLFTIFTLQLVCVALRQLFDFLGYQWMPIVINFFQILGTIITIFGVQQCRTSYVAVYVTWEVFWIGWNVFVLCFYLEVGVLSRDDNLLNLSTGSRSWWEANGFGCVAKYNRTLPDEEAWNKPVSVDGCLIHYYYLEAIQATLQILLALFGFVGGCFAIRSFGKPEDDAFSTRGASRSGPYSIEFQRQHHPTANENPYQRPMTPRKVKRRSTRSKRGQPHPSAMLMAQRGRPSSSSSSAVAAAAAVSASAAAGGSNATSLVPNGRQSFYQNPVTRLMALQNAIVGIDSSTSNEDVFSRRHDVHNLPPYAYVEDRGSGDLRGGHLNLGYQSSRHSFNENLANLSIANCNSSSSRRPSPIYMNDSETVI